MILEALAIAGTLYATPVSKRYTPPPPDAKPRPEWVVRDMQGKVIGADPDPFIRGQLRRDPPGKDGAGDD